MLVDCKTSLLYTEPRDRIKIEIQHSRICHHSISNALHDWVTKHKFIFSTLIHGGSKREMSNLREDKLQIQDTCLAKLK